MSEAMVVADEPGLAHVFDRETRRELGYVLADFHGWWHPYRDGRPVGAGTRYRADAVRELFMQFLARDD